MTKQPALRFSFSLSTLFSAFALLACSGENGTTGPGGSSGDGGVAHATGGNSTLPAGGGGTASSGGAPSQGGSTSSGGSATTGGAAAGGTATSGGSTSTGGDATSGGTVSTGGGGTTSSAGAASGRGGAGGQVTSGGSAETSNAGGNGNSAGASGNPGGGASGSGDSAGGNGGTAGAGPTLPPITDYTAKGPFTTKQENGVGPGGKYTVYRPEPLGKDGFLHAPIVFGPGIDQQVTVHTQLLTNFASHGFIVVGTPVLKGGPGDAANLKSMQDGLDWIVMQNAVAGPYQGKVWVDHVISMGFSVGGTSAVQLGGDKAVASVVSIHGHNASAALHGPMLQTTGTKDTVGMPLQQQTYDKSMVPTFLATLTGAPHQYIESNAGGDERPAIVAWMRYWIYGDQGAKKYFFGTDCVLCKAPWENPQRKNWQ